jgi:ABC-type transport system involved in multi-copper enzyme maturation permease subunit
MSRFLAVLRFELALHLRRPSTWAALLLMLVLGATFVVGLGSDMGTHVNAPASIVLYTFVLGLVGLLVTAGLFADAGARDALSRMQPLFYTTSIRKREYLAGRYLGAFAVNALVLVGAPIGMALAMLWPAFDPTMVGPFQPAAYLRGYALFLLPGLLVNSAILFGVAALTRRALTTYLGVILLYAGYAGAVALTSEVLNRRLGALVDPTGIVPVLELLRDWSPAERNTRAVTLSGPLLVNRLLWIGVGLAVLAFTYARFRFAHEATPERRRAASADAAPTASGAAHVAPARPPRVPRAFDRRARLRQVAVVARRAFGEIVSGREFQVLVVALVLFAIGFGWELSADRFGTPTWPVTGLVARFLTSGFVGIPLALVTAFYAGELVWRERDTGVGDIVDATPMADWVPLAGKTLALCGMLAVLQGALLLSGVVLQALQGYFRFELGLYLQFLFGLKLVDYVLFAAVSMLVHAVVNQKYVGHLVAVLFHVATLFAGRFGLRHTLVVYGADPGVVHSDLSGFGPFLGPYALLKAYWAGWALLLALVASLLWVRGRDLSIGRRLQLARARATPRLLAIAGPALLLVGGAGGIAFYNTNVLHAYQSPEEADAVPAEYERRYKRFDGMAQPKIAHVQLRAELHPETRRLEVQGSYVLVNRSGRAIDSVLVYLRPHLAARAMELDRPVRAVTADSAHHTWVFALARPLAPQDSLRLRFDLGYAPRGFRNRGADTDVVENGTFVEREWFPNVGYQRAAELSDPIARRAQGLPPRAPRPPATDAQALLSAGSSADADLITLDVVVGTAPDQVASSAGSLRRTWTENGRRYFHFRSDAPTANTWALLSARYAVRESVRDGIRVQVLHHPAHAYNVDRLLGAAERSLAYYTRAFGPGPMRELRIVEFPRYSTRASAYPNQVAHSESFGFISRVRDDAGDLDTPLLVTAHEVAHQWWGGIVMPANVLGRQVLSETLANYGATLVLHEVHGREAVRRFRYLMLIEYLNRRGRGDQPLLTTGDNDNVHYRKGAVVMWSLREYLGEERVNAALRALVARHGNAGPPYPTTLDLRRELQAVTPDSLRWLLTDLVETTTIWDLSTNAARATPLGAGRHRVTLEVEAGKARVDSAGREAPVPMDEQVEVVVYGEAGAAKPLYRAMHRVRTGRQTIVVDVAGEPRRAGVDPDYLLIARRGDDLADNVRDVARAPR